MTFPGLHGLDPIQLCVTPLLHSSFLHCDSRTGDQLVQSQVAVSKSVCKRRHVFYYLLDSHGSQKEKRKTKNEKYFYWSAISSPLHPNPYSAIVCTGPFHFNQRPVFCQAVQTSVCWLDWASATVRLQNSTATPRNGNFTRSLLARTGSSRQFQAVRAYSPTQVYTPLLHLDN